MAWKVRDLILLAIPVTAVLGTDVYLSCPEEWVEGADVTLTCKVDAVRVNNRTCSGQMLDLVDFQFVSSSGTDASPECQVKDYMTKACGDDGGSGSLNSRGCRCMELSDGTYVFEYVVKMDKARYDGGSWRCVPTCRDTHLDDPLTYKVEKTCTGISIKATGTYRNLRLYPLIMVFV